MRESGARADVAAERCFFPSLKTRPYKVARSVEEALHEIRRQRGFHFDPTLTDEFLDMVESNGLMQPSQSVRSNTSLSVDARVTR